MPDVRTVLDLTGMNLAEEPTVWTNVGCLFEDTSLALDSVSFTLYADRALDEWVPLMNQANPDSALYPSDRIPGGYEYVPEATGAPSYHTFAVVYVQHGSNVLEVIVSADSLTGEEALEATQTLMIDWLAP